MKSITSILAILAVGTTLTLADDKPASPATADANPTTSDGAKPKHDPAELFKKLDTNGDGKLTLEEFLAGPQGKKNPDKAKAYFQKIDKDNTGSITLDQWMAAHSGGKKGNK